VSIYDEPACIAVCPVDCIAIDNDNVETIAELKFKHEQLLLEEKE
jgi:ferredoxin